MLYAVTATRTTTTKAGYTITQQVPSFLLSSATGIVDEEHAAKVARDIVGEPCDICALELREEDI